MPFFLLATRPRTLGLAFLSTLQVSPTTPQLSEVRENVFQECGRRGSQPGLDNHRGKYLPCSWSQYWPPGEDWACSQGHVRGGFPGWAFGGGTCFTLESLGAKSEPTFPGQGQRQGPWLFDPSAKWG